MVFGVGRFTIGLDQISRMVAAKYEAKQQEKGYKSRKKVPVALIDVNHRFTET